MRTPTIGRRDLQGAAESLETRKLVERAKGPLMSAFSLSEPDAFTWIQRAAMDNRMTMKQGSEKLISENLPAAGSTPASA